MIEAATLIVTEDKTKEINDIIKSFKNYGVLVGIPESKSDRKEDGGKEQINNAALLAINVFGSPVNNIPPRDVMSIGIRNAQDSIAEEFKKCAKNVWSQGSRSLETYYTRIGIIASSAIKKAINDQDGIKGPADSTLKSRQSRGFKGTKALVVTGQMRNAITYVVKSIWGNG